MTESRPEYLRRLHDEMVARRTPRWTFWVGVGLMAGMYGIFTVILLGTVYDWPSPVRKVAALQVVWVVPAFLAMLWWSGRGIKASGAFWTAVYEAHVPMRMVDEAVTQSSSWAEGWLWAVECYESHLPGDCPLCGAD